jgi:predicted RNase H-like HicB family nuclease
MIRDYPAMIERVADGDYRIVFPDFPTCTATGPTVEQAAANGREAVLLHLVAMLADSGSVPEPSPPDAPTPNRLSQDTAWTRIMVPLEWLPRPDLK